MEQARHELHIFFARLPFKIMKTYIGELTEKQISVLQTMLNRVDLKGSEAPAFMDVVNAFSRFKEKPPQETIDKPNETP